ncbi:MAG TPA: mandelate racemase/muconate lactonizing enzyme family protein [Aggregatilineaceae bacterium]|nr:mandelate racemase/muconate lactonizing enzyme family protein [Aggregatilineaceae bacterium]
MRIVHFETFMANAGLRNYLFIRLITDTGLTGVGEASLEWQEKTVETVLHEWVASRVVGRDPFDVESVIGGMIRDQYQGGSTVMTAISGVEIALWDIIGKTCHQPIYKLIGGRYHQRLPAYANGWYGGAKTPQEFAERARETAALGYRAMKFDPFGTAWKTLTDEQVEAVLEVVAAVREAVGPKIGLMIEFHGRLDLTSASDMMRRLERFEPVWCEEPLAPENLDLLARLKGEVRSTISAGERLYTVAEFYRLITLRACDVVQMDVAHCGGIGVSKKIAAMAAAQDIRIAPHCSVGPVSLAACLHVDVSTPNFMIQENFAEFDVPWRNSLVHGWNPIHNGEFVLSEAPGLGLDIDEAEIAKHPYVQNPFPSLWDGEWLTNFTQVDR